MTKIRRRFVASAHRSTNVSSLPFKVATIRARSRAAASDHLSVWRCTRWGLFLALLGSACSAGQPSNVTEEVEDVLEVSRSELPLTLPAVEYFRVTRDLRRCASPLCGGYWVNAVNRPLTRCSDGALKSRCYVAEADWTAVGGEPLLEGNGVVARGDIESSVYPNFGELGRFVANGAWTPVSSAAPSGAFFRVMDNGIRCIAEPCFSTDAELLNLGVRFSISALDLSRTGASDEEIEAAGTALAEGKLIISGTLRLTSGTGGVGIALTASQAFLPVSASASCAADSDCDADSWCRITESGAYACVPFAGEGERCNGFTLPSSYERCSPELTCDLPEFVVDAPGICRSSCKSNADCDAGAYCATDGLCHTDATCDISMDCLAPGNDYPRILCVGYPTCPPFELPRQCGWQCGDPRCIDSAGYDLGACEKVLGWGVQFGSCVAISGCDAGELQLFESQAACEAACTG